MNRTLSRIYHGVAAFAACVLIGAAARAQVSIAQSPLFLGLNVKPNVMLGVDDSGSMDSELLLPANDGAAWWHTGNQSFTGLNQSDQAEPGMLNFNIAGTANGTWKKFVYLFPNGTGQSDGRRGYADSTHDHFAIAPIDQFAYFRSPAYNASYFDPTHTYQPWPDLGGWTFGDSAPTAAPTDPTLGSATFDLTAQQEWDGLDHVFRLFPGMTIPAGTRYLNWTSGAWENAPYPLGRTLTNADMPDPCTTLGCTYTGAGRGVGISYFPATFYLRAATSLPAGYGYMAPPGTGGIGPDGSLLYRYEIKPANFSSTAAYDAAIQNFANWFTFYRKRHAATRGGIASAFETIENFRVGPFTINNRVSPVTMLDLADSGHRDSFFDTVYSDFVGLGGTPNREAVNHMGSQLQRTGADAPIQYACQRNFGVLFTDGYSNVSTPRDVGNADGSAGQPFADSYANTMADLAMFYYQNNLRPDLTPGQVPVPPTCSTSNPDPRLDCETDPHMNMFGVTLGTKGTIFGVNSAATADPFANPPAWPNPTAVRNPVQVDDLWHATVDSRGSLLNVAVPSALGAQFRAVLGAIADRITSSSAVAANSTRLDTQTLIYQARFRSDDWTGQLLAYRLNMNGSLGPLQWDAANVIPGHASRAIYTRNGSVPGSAAGAAFLWANLSAAQQAALNQRPDGTVDALGPQRLAWLRGDRAQEQRLGGPFRNRSVLLGDIVNSDPQFVGVQNFGYQDLPPSTPGQSTYVSYRQGKMDTDGSALKPMLYVGANDGMLHAFDAETGLERLAYIPSTLIPELNELPDSGYAAAHRYYVDGQVVIGDAYIDRGGVARWASVLVGATGGGGRTVFALDVTDPHNFTAGSVMWEFTDPDLGYSMGQPMIARMADGTWAAVFGNGYNSDNHRAVLFIVRLEDGVLLRKIDTLVGDATTPNGLAQPSLIANGSRTIQAIYAGDLRGNLWEFDVSQTNPGNWQSAYSQSSSPAPLFTARDALGNPQPITAPVEVGRHPEGGYMIFFGTGKYFESTDNLVGPTPQVQSFYGVWDKGTGPGSHISGSRSTVLTEQRITYEGTPAGSDFEVRVTTQNTVDWSTKVGWYLDLRSPNNGAEGERVVAAPALRNGRIIFPTLIPSPNPCGFGGSSWLMELAAVTGTRLEKPPLDINGDGKIDDNDRVDADINGDGVIDEQDVSPSGVRSNEGIIDSPAIIGAGELEYKLASGTSGNVEMLRERGAFDRARGSWRQLR